MSEHQQHTLLESIVDVNVRAQELLAADSELLALAAHASAKFRELTPDNVHFTLDVDVNVEGPELSERLFLVLKWSGDFTEGYELLDKFEEDWWLANQHRAGGKLSATIEFS